MVRIGGVEVMKKLVICSGYFNPIHRGHVDYLTHAKSMGDELAVIVNSDNQVLIKGSKPFMEQDERAYIVKALHCVNESIVSIDEDSSVCESIRDIFNKYSLFYDLFFANGGDRKNDNIPEYELCEELGIEMLFGIGGGKSQSSSDLIKGVING